METYNSYHFDDKINLKLNERLDGVIENELKVVSLLKQFLKSANNNQQKDGHNSLLHLLVKIRLNFESVNLITPLLRDDYRFKTSANLLYRSIIDDNINLLYLLGFVIPNSENQVSLKNELNILHRDFIESCEKIIEAQANINKRSNEFLKANFYEEINIDLARKEIVKKNPEIFNSNKNKWKSNSEIRETSGKYFTKYFEELNLNHSNLISAKKKIDLIKMQNYPNCDILTSLNKYYTQYFHFSPKTHDLVLNHIEFDLQCYWLTIIETLTILGIANKVLKKDNDFEEEINNHLKSFIN